MTTSALKKHRVGRADVVIGPYKSEFEDGSLPGVCVTIPDICPARVSADTAR